ncbi:MAG: hypothetical protein N3D85_05585 [Candidatus Bathyarchaeota archaeon]|nr:hypothetical protein [Candidatus Bathyarchaeota archaeon]
MSKIETQKADPFLLDIKEVIRIIQEYFPKWNQPEELNLDAEAIHHIASVIKMQNEWVKQRTTSMYKDTFLFEEKIRQQPAKEVVEAFLKAWHPLTALEQVTLQSLTEALQYWATLKPLKERWPNSTVPNVEAGVATRSELINQSILRDEAFSTELESCWHQLKDKVQREGVAGKIFYMDFVGADTYEETVHRAYLTSFLVTCGYATLELVPLEEEIFIKPLDKPLTKLGQQAVSVPISLSFDDWQRWKRGRNT